MLSLRSLTLGIPPNVSELTGSDESFREIHRLSSLTRLFLLRTNAGLTGKCLEYIKLLPSLRELSFYDSLCSSEDVGNVAYLNSISSLETVMVYSGGPRTGSMSLKMLAM